LALYGSVYAYTTYKTNKTFQSERVIDKNFKIYEDMLELQRWVYGLTLYLEE